MHLVWMSVFVPGMLFVVWAFPAGRQPNIWSVAFAVAMLGLAGVVGFDLFGYFSQGEALSGGFMRAVFAVITTTDIPLIALAVGSLACWILTRRKGSSSGRSVNHVASRSADRHSLED